MLGRTVRTFARASGQSRQFSASSAVLNEFVFRPALAAKQIIPEDASKSKVKSLKRKEKKLKRQITRDINNLKQHNLRNIKFKVDPVLGDPENGFMKRVREELNDQSNLALGYKREEVEKLFYGVEKATLAKNKVSSVLFESAAEIEERKKNAVLTVLNIKNTSSKDKKSLAVARAKKEFARTEGDTGSPEVQAAVLTVKIHLGVDHMKASPKDKVHIQNVREMVQQRQQMLKYLKRTRPEDYFYCIAKLGLTDDVITREFSMDRQYLQDYQVWPEKQLVKLSDKQQRKEQKFHDLQKKIAAYNHLAKKNFTVLKL